MENKNKVKYAAVVGLTAGLLSVAPSAFSSEVHCWGVNSCGAKSSAKDKAQCSVNEAQVAAANKEFGNKFSKSTVHSCGSSAECSGKAGFLNWTKVKSKDECKKLGGFLMDKKGKIEKL
ncbi:MAG: hypothetical protein DCC88_09275 [Spirobacillus cienkowskii]|jgi:hypothetical protein|uniref:DUF2282 domain-containing protein n=1 Tax=Spirobacillus cienkowskii TaxID=495820 RepID=A0A369KSA2_9BACT|nr:MAG: hypothetical protein DCC88_09275 [Spirobacillus cienkowskii]